MIQAAATETTPEILPPENSVAVYNPFRQQLAELKETNAKLVFDYETEEGAKEAKSHIAKLRSTKGALEKARKAEKQESLDYGRKVDAEAKEIEGELNAMIAVHETPLLEIAQRETDRKAAIQVRIDNILAQQRDIATCSAAEIQVRIEKVGGVEITVAAFAESMHVATSAKDTTLMMLNDAHAAAVKRETEAAELERLRTEEAERQRLAREETIRKEAEEKAAKDAQKLIDEADARRQKGGARRSAENCRCCRNAAQGRRKARAG